MKVRIGQIHTAQLQMSVSRPHRKEHREILKTLARDRSISRTEESRACRRYNPTARGKVQHRTAPPSSAGGISSTPVVCAAPFYAPSGFEDQPRHQAPSLDALQKR